MAWYIFNFLKTVAIIFLKCRHYLPVNNHSDKKLKNDEIAANFVPQKDDQSIIWEYHFQPYFDPTKNGLFLLHFETDFFIWTIADFRSMQQVYPIDVRLSHFMGKKPCHGHHLLDKKTIMLFRLFSRLGQFCLETLRQYFKLFIILLKVSFLSTTTSTMVAVKPTSFLASHAARYLNEKYVAMMKINVTLKLQRWHS